MNCPLCAGSNTTLQNSLETSLIISRWKKDLAIDVRSEFGEAPVIEVYKCRGCNLGFFKPDSLAGSPALYEALEKIDWYYMPRKWEHDVALEDLEGCDNGIEVGCGFGDFIARVSREKGIAFEGCEQNPSAVDIARRRGVYVCLETVQHLAEIRPRIYSAVCSFQVLEHVVDPASFLAAACELLRPGGKLMLGLPNGESFLRYQFNLFDMPPHHMTRWTESVLTHLQTLFPLKLLRVACEPLQDYHVVEYVDAQTNRLSRLFMHPGIRSRLARLIRASGIQRHLLDQTIYACYQRL